jgi:hypothetical protein
MSIVTQCTTPGCETLTMGPLCIEHDLPVTKVFVRGRPWAPATNGAVVTSALQQAAFADLTTVRHARRAWARREAARALR